MTQPPLVSIVTPSFNQGRFLRRTVDSVLGQSYPYLDYRVIDGGSTDDSVAILRSYGDRFPWVSEPDRGQTHAINKGFALARGDIHAYLNSDDVLLPDAVATVVRHFQERPECDVVYGLGQWIDADDRFLDWYPTAPYSFERLMHDCCVCQPAAFWRASAARRVGPFDERLRFAMDYDYWIRLALAGARLEHLPVPLAGSRLYPETKTLSSRVPVYREVVRVCLERAGFVDWQYVRAMWHHRCQNERLLRLLTRLPGFESAAAGLHFRWLHRGRRRRLPAAAA